MSPSENLVEVGPKGSRKWLGNGNCTVGPAGVRMQLLASRDVTICDNGSASGERV